MSNTADRSTKAAPDQSWRVHRLNGADYAAVIMQNGQPNGVIGPSSLLDFVSVCVNDRLSPTNSVPLCPKKGEKKISWAIRLGLLPSGSSIKNVDLNTMTTIDRAYFKHKIKEAHHV